MPNFDGVETILSIKKFNPDLPVIGMTGGFRGVSGTYEGMLRELGASGVLRKPFSSQEIVTMIDNVVAGRQAGPDLHEKEEVRKAQKKRLDQYTFSKQS